MAEKYLFKEILCLGEVMVIFHKIRERVGQLSVERGPSSFLLLGLMVTLYFQHLWVPGFFHDGNMYAALGKNAAEMNRFLIPYFGQTVYSDFNLHPPLMFMLEGLFFKIFPATWASARLFNLLVAVTLVLMIWGHLWGGGAGRWGRYAACVLILSPPFIKAARYPNLDVLLTLFCLASLLCYHRSCHEQARRWVWWPLCGLFFGLGLLTKGIPALVVPATVFFDGLRWGRYRQWINPWPWCGLLLGLGLFGLWPLLLHQQGKLDLFLSYLDMQFVGTVIKGRGKQSFSFHVYPWHLIKFTGPWFLLALISLFRSRQRREHLNSCDRQLLELAQVYFMVLLGGLSLMNWKYSHYILPIYPVQALLAGHELSRLATAIQRWLVGAIWLMFLVVGSYFLILPDGPKTFRDPELHQIETFVSALPRAPIKWLVVEHAYGLYNVVNFQAFRNSKVLVLPLSQNQLVTSHVTDYTGTLILVRRADYLKKRHIFENFSLRPWIFFKDAGLMVLLAQDLFPQTAGGEYLQFE